jgi:predicted nucleic acid-binding protein
VHKIYINVASKVYKNAYLFDKHASPLVQQKHNREFEIIIEECILKTIRDSIPTEAIVRAYLDESVEQEEEEIVTVTTEENGVEKIDVVENVVEEEKEKEKEMKEDKPLTFDDVPTITNMDDKPVVNRLTFDDIDHAITADGKEEKIVAPKSVERLEKISEARYHERKNAEAEEADEDTLKISDDISIDLGFTDLNPYEKKEDDVVVLNDIEELF